MAKYEYDESGATFYYFLLSLVVMLLLPSTISLLSRQNDSREIVACDCKACCRKVALRKVVDRRSALGKLNKRFTFTTLGWIFVGFVAYKVYHTEAPVVVLWDPYQILGLDHSATASEVKKAYRLLSKTQHPDKVPEAEKEQANVRFAEIAKAQAALTDEDLRNNWEEFGHPDGKQAMSLGIALPTWMVEGQNSLFVLLVYGVGFGFFLPFLVGRWWYRAKRYTKDLILNNTMGIYFKEMKETTTLRGLVDVLISAEEFRDELPSGPVLSNSDENRNGKGADKGKKASSALEGVAKNVRLELERRGDRLEKMKKELPPHVYRTGVLLMAHMLRIPVEDAVLLKDQTFIVEKCIHLLHGMLQITIARDWLQTSMNCIDLSQCLVQALWLNDTPLLQLPHITATAECLKHTCTKKRNIKTIDQLMSMDEVERKSLLRTLSKEQMTELERNAALYPVLDVVKAEFKVAGDQAVTPGAIVNFVCRLRLRAPGATIANSAEEKITANDFDDEDNEDHPIETPARRKRRLAEEAQKAPAVHAPYLLNMEKKPHWWIFLGDQKTNRCVVSPTKVGGLGTERTYKLQFQAPPKAGMYIFKAIIKSDSYAGGDVQSEVKLHVQDPSVLPPEPDIDDDISEPDEDSIAGQMELLRKQGLAGAVGGGGGAGGAGAKGSKTEVDSDDDSSSDEDGDD